MPLQKPEAEAARATTRIQIGRESSMTCGMKKYRKTKIILLAAFHCHHHHPLPSLLSVFYCYLLSIFILFQREEEGSSYLFQREEEQGRIFCFHSIIFLKVSKQSVHSFVNSQMNRVRSSLHIRRKSDCIHSLKVKV